MTLSSIREGELKDVFDELEEAFENLNIDFYLIGALARDVWYARGISHSEQRKTLTLRS